MTAPGAALVALRRVGEVVCTHCGKTFVARLTKQGPRYCSGSCRTLAYRKRGRRLGEGNTNAKSQAPLLP